jgi:hypothetical protein
MTGAERERLSTWLRSYGAGLATFATPLYGELLQRAADDLDAGGPTLRVLDGREEDPQGSALPLRFVNAVHRLVLQGRAPALERFFRPGGDDPREAWAPFVAVLEEHLEELRGIVARPCQTNEVGRSAALAPGFCEIARITGLPLRLLEVGCSAGLNLRWDRYRYEGRSWRYGPEDARVRFPDMFSNAEPPPPPDVDVVSRAGCDPNPIDPTTADGKLTLMSFVWPDVPRRLDNVRAACEVASDIPVDVIRASAVDWLPERLAESNEGIATVVYHSIVMQYVGAEGRARISEALEAAGERATREAPLAHLSFEPDDVETGLGAFELRLRLWPEGHERLLARPHPHGPPIEWVAQ